MKNKWVNMSLFLWSKLFFILVFPSVNYSNICKYIQVEKKKIPQCGIQDFPVWLTFSYKAYKHVLILKKGFQSVQRVQSVQSVQRVQSVQSLQKRAVAQQRFPKCPKCPKCPTCPKWPKYTKVWHSMNACEWVTDMANPWDAYAQNLKYWTIFRC